MAQPSTLYRFKVDLTDIDRGVYESLDVRTPMHPSESELFLVTRMLAYSLNYREGIQFSKLGLSEPEDPCLSVKDADGVVDLWIEIGNPSARKLHKANKSSRKVKVYTYKNPELLLQEIRGEKIYQPERIEIYSFGGELLKFLVERLGREAVWTLIHQDKTVTVHIAEDSAEGDLISHSI